MPGSCYDGHDETRDARGMLSRLPLPGIDSDKINMQPLPFLCAIGGSGWNYLVMLLIQFSCSTFELHHARINGFVLG